LDVALADSEQPCFAAQQLAGAAGWANAASNSVGGTTPCVLAQASRSAGEWQQQLVQQHSAFVQPHGLFMQGNGRERSLVL
jgi:hypothetical protein